MARQSRRSGTAVGRIVGVLIACWCLAPVLVTFGFLLWASIEAPWPWKLPFIAGVAALLIGSAIWGGARCRECRGTRQNPPAGNH